MTRAPAPRESPSTCQIGNASITASKVKACINDGDIEMELLWFNSPSAFGPVSGYHDLTATWIDVRGRTHPADG